MKLFTTPTCAPCKALKQVLQAEGLDAGLTIEQVVEEFPKEVRGVPTLQTDDGQFITGLQYILSHLRHKKELQQ